MSCRAVEVWEYSHYVSASISNCQSRVLVSFVNTEYIYYRKFIKYIFLTVILIQMLDRGYYSCIRSHKTVNIIACTKGHVQITFVFHFMDIRTNLKHSTMICLSFFSEVNGQKIQGGGWDCVCLAINFL